MTNSIAEELFHLPKSACKGNATQKLGDVAADDDDETSTTGNPTVTAYDEKADKLSTIFFHFR